MRALPDLSLLPPLGDVWDPVADDFTQLLADQSDTFDSLQAQMDPIADQSLANIATLDADVDAVGQVFTGIDGTFGQLDTSINDLENSNELQNALSAESGFAIALDDWNFDADSQAGSILLYIIGLVNLSCVVCSAPIQIAIQGLEAEVDSLAGQIQDLYFGGSFI